MRRGLVALLLLLLCGSFSSAAEEQRLSLSGLTHASHVVGTGRVVELRTFFTGGEIWTLVTVSMDQVLKGEGASVVRFRVPGGQQQVRGRTLVTRVEGAPELNVNQRTLLFLHSVVRDYYDLSSLGQGCWPVNVRDGKEVAAPSDAPDAPGLPLQYMMEEVRDAVKNERRSQ